MCYRQKKKRPSAGSLGLSYQDSNLDKQNQNLMCYHYTIGQSKTVQKYYFFATWPNLFCMWLKNSVTVWKRTDYLTVPANLM